MAQELGVGTDQVAGLRPPRGERVLDRLGDPVGRDALPSAFVQEAARLVDEPPVTLPSLLAERALEDGKSLSRVIFSPDGKTLAGGYGYYNAEDGTDVTLVLSS